MADTKLQTAYTTVIDAEKQLITEVEAKLNDALTAIEALLAPFPTGMNTSSAVQFVQQSKQQLQSQLGYPLMNVRQSYGIPSPALSPVVPTATTPTT